MFIYLNLGMGATRTIRFNTKIFPYIFFVYRRIARKKFFWILFAYVLQTMLGMVIVLDVRLLRPANITHSMLNMEKE